MEYLEENVAYIRAHAVIDVLVGSFSVDVELEGKYRD